MTSVRPNRRRIAPELQTGSRPACALNARGREPIHNSHSVDNGDNRPVRWVKGDEVVAMSFDRQGRRVTKNAQRFVYDGYLCIKGIENTATIHYSLSPIHCFVWDPTESVATRPLVWNRGGEVSYYAHDGNKNVSDVVASNGAVVAHYDYAPFGAVIAQSGALASANPFGFSSEYADRDLGLVYYNYRHYDPVTGRWLSRDPIGERGGLSLYGFVKNDPLDRVDRYGRDIWIENTTAAAGFHWRVCVDLWLPAKKGTCCKNGIWWKRSGKYCISFGAKNRWSASSSSGSSSSSSDSEEDDGYFKKDSEFPVGFGGSGTNGIVYFDENDDPSGPWGDVKGIVSYKSLGCKCDGKIKEYFTGLINKESTYSVFSQNCRDFSQKVFDKFKMGCAE